MLIHLLGFIHLIHCPLLIIYPYITHNINHDLLYILYFILIVLSYILFNNECLISYSVKKIINKTYIAGSKMNYYPEMYIFTQNDQLIKLYFTITTLVYIYSLYIVIMRINLFDLNIWKYQIDK